MKKESMMKSLCAMLIVQVLFCCAVYGVNIRPQASNVYNPEGFKYPVSKESQNYKWTEMGRNKAAVSNDCLYVQHGPATTLADCEAACANQTLCNAINYNEQEPDCVFRACRNPEDPDLSRTPGYNCYTIPKKFVPLPSNSSLVKLVSSPHYLQRWHGRNITFFGDSITWLDTYITELSDAITHSKHTKKIDVNLVNRGINGGTIQDIRAGGTYFGQTYPSFAEALKMDKPAVVSIQIGINDVWWPTRNDSSKLPEFKQILAQLIHEVKAMNISIYISTVSVIGERRDGQNPFDHNLDAYAAGQVQVAKETGVFVSNLRHAYLSYDLKENAADDYSGILTYDGVHPTGYGAQLLANHHAQGLLSFSTTSFRGKN
eukprot:TRINITY_DN4553_c0_g1_i1.p1 TRINITY_DN4553_c0_g1~~TRINITY_DN4553_c0_g1_i1.p1  ORF type:complete len:408 (-),score=88.08 TRINITY_DN4553_c0_g1_i1:50-1171(-)